MTDSIVHQETYSEREALYKVMLNSYSKNWTTHKVSSISDSHTCRFVEEIESPM